MSRAKAKVDPWRAELMKAWHATATHPLFRVYRSFLEEADDGELANDTWAIVTDDGDVRYHPKRRAPAEEWMWVFAHLLLHLGFGHADPRVCAPKDVDGDLPHPAYHAACCLVVERFLRTLKIGRCPWPPLPAELPDNDEVTLSAQWRRLAVPAQFEPPGEPDFRLDRRGQRRGGGDLRQPARPALRARMAFRAGPRDAARRAPPRRAVRHARPVPVERRLRKLATLRGRGLGDVLDHPPLPWDAQLARWFDEHFQPEEKRRSYARASRRQASSPGIPRPGWVRPEEVVRKATFGVVLDTSGSMDVKLLGKALGAIASYATARDVPRARVVFWDAAAYDAGYLPVEEIAGKVRVRGRGGTVLQPGVRLLEQAGDFPPDGPILVITDGECEVLRVRREHAFLVPQGASLPFRPRGPVFFVK